MTKEEYDSLPDGTPVIGYLIGTLDKEKWNGYNASVKIDRATTSGVRASAVKGGRFLLEDVRPLDHVKANVFADWLEENGEPEAAGKLREAFPALEGTFT